MLATIRHIYYQRMHQWLQKRIPESRSFQLNMGNIFIFPSRFGLMFLVICISLFLLGSNYQNNLMLLLCYFLLALFLVNLFTGFTNFSRLGLQLGKTHPVFAEDELLLPLWFKNQQGKQAQDLVQGQLYFHFWKQSESFVFDPQTDTSPVQLTLDAKQRGYFELPRITIASYYPLGLFRCWTHLKFTGHYWVYPKPVICPLSYRTFDTDDYQEGELQTIGQDDFDSLSTYQPGEPLNRVAWKQVAKGQGMVSKNFSGNQQQQLVLDINLLSDSDIELKLGKLSFMVLELSKNNSQFALDLGKQSISCGSGAEHRENCLKALALYQNKPSVGVG